MKMGQIIILAMVAVLTFPVMYITMLLLKGNVKLVYNLPDNPLARKQNEVALEKQSARKDSLTLAAGSTYRALKQQQEELEEERKNAFKEAQRVEMIKEELEKEREILAQKKKEIEQSVSQSSEAEMKRVKQLAKVYASMRASEAALILETLEDDLLTKILLNISDDRQKAKILGALSKEKASAVSVRMGKMAAK